MNPYVLLVKLAVEEYIKEKKIIEPPKDLPPDFFERKAGVFITINKQLAEQGKASLRACLGTYLPTKINIAQEIISNAVAASTEDFRFGQIEEAELPFLAYQVYILSYPELIKGLDELNPKKFGLIVKTTPFVYPNETEEEKVIFDGHVPFKTGLLLPGLKGVESAQEQFSIACQKAGIDPNKEKTFIYRFSVEEYQ